MPKYDRSSAYGWPTSVFLPGEAHGYGPYTFHDPPWLTELHGKLHEDGFHRWQVSGKEVLLLPRIAVAEHLRPAIAHWFDLEPVEPWLGCPMLELWDSRTEQVVRVIPPYLLVSPHGVNGCYRCTAANPPRRCTLLACSPPNPATGRYPRLDPQGSEEFPTSFGCLECRLAGEKCSKLGSMLDGENYGKKGTLDGKPVKSPDLEDIFALPDGYTFHASENTHKTRHFTLADVRAGIEANAKSDIPRPHIRRSQGGRTIRAPYRYVNDPSRTAGSAVAAGFASKKQWASGKRKVTSDDGSDEKVQGRAGMASPRGHVFGRKASTSRKRDPSDRPSAAGVGRAALTSSPAREILGGESAGEAYDRGDSYLDWGRTLGRDNTDTAGHHETGDGSTERVKTEDTSSVEYGERTEDGLSDGDFADEASEPRKPRRAPNLLERRGLLAVARGRSAFAANGWPMAFTVTPELVPVLKAKMDRYEKVREGLVENIEVILNGNAGTLGSRTPPGTPPSRLTALRRLIPPTPPPSNRVADQDSDGTNISSRSSTDIPAMPTVHPAAESPIPSFESSSGEPERSTDQTADSWTKLQCYSTPPADPAQNPRTSATKDRMVLPTPPPSSQTEASLPSWSSTSAASSSSTLSHGRRHNTELDERLRDLERRLFEKAAECERLELKCEAKHEAMVKAIKGEVAASEQVVRLQAQVEAMLGRMQAGNT